MSLAEPRRIYSIGLRGFERSIVRKVGGQLPVGSDMPACSPGHSQQRTCQEQTEQEKAVHCDPSNRLRSWTPFCPAGAVYPNATVPAAGEDVNDTARVGPQRREPGKREARGTEPTILAGHVRGFLGMYFGSVIPPSLQGDA